MDDKRLGDLENRLSAIERVLNIRQDVMPGQEKPPQPEKYIPSSSPQIPKGDVESYIGRWILGIVGVVAILFGTSFFLKYAFENGLIGPAGRVAMGVVGGVLLIFLGEYLRPRLVKYSFILSGGGLGLLYLSTYGAFWYYDFIGQGTAFGFMSLITLFGVVLAVWVDAIPISAISIFGGFLTPFLLSTGVSNDFGFFMYLAILNLTVLAVAFFKKWHALIQLGFVLTILNFISWYGSYYKTEKLFFAIFVLSAFYVIYALAGVIANIANKKLADSNDLFILTINPAWYFGWLYFLLQAKYELSLGFIAVILGAFYILLAYIASNLRSEDKKLTLFLGAIAVVFLTIAIPLELKQNAITIAWAIEAALLFALGAYLRNEGMRIFSLGVLIISLIRLFAYDSLNLQLNSFIIFFNKRFFTYLMIILGSSLMAYIAIQNREKFTQFEKGTQFFLATVLNLLILIAITSEISYFFEAKLYSLNNDMRSKQEQSFVPGNYYNDSYNVYQNQLTEQHKSVTNRKNATISVFWTLYAILLITLGIMKRSAYLRWTALILFGITIGKVFLVDLTVLSPPLRIMSFMVLGVILLLASYLYFKFRSRLEGASQKLTI